MNAFRFRLLLLLLGCGFRGLALCDSLRISALLAVSDGNGCIYVVSRENILSKIDTTLSEVSTVNLAPYGFASSLECRGSNEVIVYCYGTGRLVVFDNFLKEKNQFDLSTLLRTKPNLVCISSYGWWCFDETNSSLSKYNGNFSLLYTYPRLLGALSGAMKMAEADEKFLVFERSDHTLTPLPVADDAVTVLPEGVENRTSPALNYHNAVYYTLGNDSVQIVQVLSGRILRTAMPPGVEGAQYILKSNGVFYIIRKNAVFLRHVPFLLAP